MGRTFSIDRWSKKIPKIIFRKMAGNVFQFVHNTTTQSFLMNLSLQNLFFNSSSLNYKKLKHKPNDIYNKASFDHLAKL